MPDRIANPGDINKLDPLYCFSTKTITKTVVQSETPASTAVNRLLNLLSSRWLDETAINDATSRRCAMMRTSLLIAVFGIGLLDAIPVLAAPGIQPWNTNCNRFYAQWKTKPNHKAFTVANSPGGQGCGGSWGAGSKKAAEDSALKACKRTAEDAAHCIVTKSE